MRVLHLTTSLNTGGAEIMLAGIAQGLERRGHSNSVISLTGLEPVGRQLQEAGFPVVSLGLRTSRVPGLGALRLGLLIRRQRPDIVQGWMYHGNLAASVGRWLAGRRVPVVWSVHASLMSGTEAKPLTRWVIRLNARLSGTAAATVFCSRTSADQHYRIGFDRERSVVIPNGIDCARFRPDPDAKARLRAMTGAPAEAFLVGLFARHDPMKDHRNLFEAVGRLRARGVPVHLVLAGGGVTADDRRLGTAIAERDLQQHVALLGERRDIEALASGLDLFVLPSAYGEAFPLVLGEAMAAGVPCVATSLGDCAWIVGDTGTIVPPRDAVALAEAIAAILGASPDERRRRGDAARARIVEHFSLPEITRRYEELYHAVVARRAELGLPLARTG